MENLSFTRILNEKDNNCPIKERSGLDNIINDLRNQYILLYGEEPVARNSIKELEQRLEIELPNDFKEISSFYSGGLLGGISHNAIASNGPATNMFDETSKLRLSEGLPLNLVVIATPPISLIVMDCSATNDIGSDTIIWCDSHDAVHLQTGKFISQPQTWPKYTDFFRYLIDQEHQERS